MHANNNANAYPKQSMHLVSSNCIWVTLLVLTIRIAIVIHSATPVHKTVSNFLPASWAWHHPKRQWLSVVWRVRQVYDGQGQLRIPLWEDKT